MRLHRGVRQRRAEQRVQVWPRSDGGDAAAAEVRWHPGWPSQKQSEAIRSNQSGGRGQIAPGMAISENIAALKVIKVMQEDGV